MEIFIIINSLFSSEISSNHSGIHWCYLKTKMNVALASKVPLFHVKAIIFTLYDAMSFFLKKQKKKKLANKGNV
jgi:hypothetical protein